MLVRDSLDAAGVQAIRDHLKGIAQAFAAGDFETPGFVHDQPVPGTRLMTAKKAVIRYVFHPLPGALKTSDLRHQTSVLMSDV